MICRTRGLAALACAWMGANAAVAQTGSGAFALTDPELMRLGVTLGAVEVVDRVEVAAGPAAVVVPSARQALVSAPQGGVVGRLLAAEGDSVTAGQPLAEIESADYLERQRDYLDAAAEADLAATQEARDRDLFEQGIIAERRLAETRAAARAAQSRLEQARAQLDLAGLSRADIARLATERRLATKLVLRAPFAGTVTEVHSEVGGRVDMLDPVLAVADLRELWLEVRLPQESAARVSVGMSVAVMPPGGSEIVGTVTTIGGVVDTNTQTVLVRATVENGGGALRAGQFLTARVRAQPSGGKAFAVPTAAVTRNGADALVFVRVGANVAVRRVDVLGDDGERVYVGGGIGPADRIAVEGISALKALWLSSSEEGG
jgi:cobalt-zinc-cadmium efflux system membrane fusion protein